LCVCKFCVSKLCAIKLCVRRRRERRRREREREEADGMQNQKQEPHTKMWGKHVFFDFLRCVHLLFSTWTMGKHKEGMTNAVVMATVMVKN
jgi:hypothetical protein